MTASISFIHHFTCQKRSVVLLWSHMGREKSKLSCPPCLFDLRPQLSSVFQILSRKQSFCLANRRIFLLQRQISSFTPLWVNSTILLPSPWMMSTASSIFASISGAILLRIWMTCNLISSSFFSLLLHAFYPKTPPHLSSSLTLS